jgi:hypothetical protein
VTSSLDSLEMCNVHRSADFRSVPLNRSTAVICRLAYIQRTETPAVSFHPSLYFTWMTLRQSGCCRGKALDLCSGDTRFESWLGHQVSCLRFFMVFFNPSTQIPGYYLYYTTTDSFQILSNLSLILSFNFM